MTFQSHHRLSETISGCVLVALLCNLFSGYGALTSFVLCIGQHGHVAVERAGHDHGDERLSVPWNQTGAFQSTDLSELEKNAPPVQHDSFEGHAPGSIEPCLDVPIGQGDHARDSILESILQYLTAFGCTLYAVVLCLIVVRSPVLLHPRFYETNPISSTPVLRRSTVLLI